MSPFVIEIQNAKSRINSMVSNRRGDGQESKGEIWHSRWCDGQRKL